LSEEEPRWSKEYQGKMIGAIINDLFGIVNPDQNFQDFAKDNKLEIEKIIVRIPYVFEELLIPLTDALRTAVLCDYQDGVDNSGVLARAQERGILLAERELPMPNRFIELVRRLGSAFGLVSSPGDA